MQFCVCLFVCVFCHDGYEEYRTDIRNANNTNSVQYTSK